MRDSVVILAKNIKLDKNYKAVLKYTEAEMISLLTNQSNLVYQTNKCQFLRETGQLKLSASYSTCIQANYLAFRNPDYSNKWFFAFIDSVEYKGEGTTIINYTIDVFSTWFDYWDPKPCYIIRQHAVTDNVGDNTVPEGQELGEYVGNGYPDTYSGFEDYYFVVVSSTDTTGLDEFPITNLGGIWTNGHVYVCSSVGGAMTLIETIKGNAGAEILNCYLVPQILFPQDKLLPQGTNVWLVDNFSDPVRIQYTPFSSMPTSLNGYNPVNQKLLTYPYCYCLMSNNNGATNLIQYEKSQLENHGIRVSFWGVPTVGASIYAMIEQYNNDAMNNIEGIVGGKYPTCGWSEDSYTNWLTQNSVNNALKFGIAGLQVVGGVALMATGAGSAMGAGLLSSGLTQAVNAGMQYYEHSREPDSFKGNINAGDVLMSMGLITFEFRPMSIKYEYARKIDRFFTRYGYRLNETTTPNFDHRQNYNYIQIASEENIGYPNNNNNLGIPASDMEMINNMFRGGITIWNNHTNLGDYSVSNNITS